MRNSIDRSYTYNRLMAIIPARNAQGGLPKIPGNIRPALTQIAHAEISSTDLLMSSLKVGLRMPVEWDHYGIAVERSGGYDAAVRQLLDLGYVNTGIEFEGDASACLLQSQRNPHGLIKVFDRSAEKGRTAAKLDYLAFTVGCFYNYPGHDPFNREFDALVAAEQKPVTGPDILGIDQRGLIFERREVASWGTTQQGILDGYTFQDILILDRHTPKR